MFLGCYQCFGSFKEKKNQCFGIFLKLKLNLVCLIVNKVWFIYIYIYIYMYYHDRSKCNSTTWYYLILPYKSFHVSTYI